MDAFVKFSKWHRRPGRNLFKIVDAVPSAKA